ncbi:MAG: BON domain-containing protein [Pirellulales bacterium]
MHRESTPWPSTRQQRDEPHRGLSRLGSELGPAAEKDPSLVEARQRLSSSPYAPLHDVTCTFHEGVLVLHGRVGSFYLKQLASAAVDRIVGVEEVSNRVEVVSSRN